MLAKICSGANIGLDCRLVTVEVDIASSGLPSLTIVGLGDRAIEESKERVRAAIKNSGSDFPSRRITINLAPADISKEGPIFDLPIALGLLIASGQIPEQIKGLDISKSIVAGELSLDGTLRKTTGILPLALLAKEAGFSYLIVPNLNAKEASVVEGITVIGLDSLKELTGILMGQLELTIVKPLPIELDEDLVYEYDFSQIKGQEQSKRALEIAAAGGHNVLLKGPPGAGKTLLCRSFPSILPPMDLSEALEVTKIYSISGNLGAETIITKRPFRSPHHTASSVGIIGGGNNIKPGEISLAHRGVLFLDELPEFPRQVLESLRQPLEDHFVTISRASGSISFPAKFMLLASQNPCPCGFLGDKKKMCKCMPGQIAKYKHKVSGPLLDRIDIYLEVPAVEVEKLSSDLVSEDSKTIRKRVKEARNIQKKRFNGRILTNSEMKSQEIRQFCSLTQEGLDLLKMAVSSFNLSARSYHRVLKVARTIADLSESENILTEHIAESLQFRTRDES